MTPKTVNPSFARLVEEMAAIAGEGEAQAIQKVLEEWRVRMLRAPFRSRVLSPDEVLELLSYAPKA